MKKGDWIKISVIRDSYGIEFEVADVRIVEFKTFHKNKLYILKEFSDFASRVVTTHEYCFDMDCISQITQVSPYEMTRIKLSEIQNSRVFTTNIVWKDESFKETIEGFVKPPYDFNLEYRLRDLASIGIPVMGWAVESFGFEDGEFLDKPIRLNNNNYVEKADRVVFRRVE